MKTKILRELLPAFTQICKTLQGDLRRPEVNQVIADQVLPGNNDSPTEEDDIQDQPSIEGNHGLPESLQQTDEKGECM